MNGNGYLEFANHRELQRARERGATFLAVLSQTSRRGVSFPH